jgi:serralysin
MVLDLLAIQYLYGADQSINAGATTYSYGDTHPYMETLWDGGGIDVIRYSGSRAASVDLQQGHGSQIGTPVTALTSSGATYAINNVWIAYGVDIEDASTGSGNDLLQGNALANVLNGGSGNDSINGGLGDDSLIGGSGNDTIDGGGGYDVAYLSGNDSSYQTRVNGSIRTMAGPDGSDSYTNVFRFHFDNVSEAYDIDGHAGQAYRLYKAAFNRTPDLGGMGYQMHALDGGMSLSRVAGNFIASPEFQSRYGNLDNTQFISLLYQNVLNRAADPSGLQFHLDELAHGETRADLLTHFSESPENQANVIGQIANGILYTT